MEDVRIQELLDSVGKYFDGDTFDRFKTEEFFRYPHDYRVQILMGWDRMMQQEIRPTRETASLISKKRELDDLHALLSRAGR